MLTCELPRDGSLEMMMVTKVLRLVWWKNDFCRKHIQRKLRAYLVSMRQIRNIDLATCYKNFDRWSRNFVNSCCVNKCAKSCFIIITTIIVSLGLEWGLEQSSFDVPLDLPKITLISPYLL